MGSLWPPVGSHLGHYRLVEKLDEGGVGAVYKAHEAALDRHVAIKVLSPELAKDVSFVHQFLREARAVAALNHPNIIQIYFIGQHDEYIYFAMELVQGRTLDRLLNQPQRPSERELISMIRQAAMGLQYAQQHGVIHRDIKPSNLILNELGLVKVADFGLARKVGQGGDPNASSMSVADSLGTPEYMSPEDAANEPIDHRSDIYSLGATLYHLLAGKPLFTGKSGTEVLMHQIHTPPPSIRRVNPQVSPQTAAIVERCLAKKPEARFQTYEQLIKAIDDTLAGRTPVAHVPRATVHLPQTQQTPLKVKPRGPGPMVWVLVLLILGAAGVGIWQISERQKAGGLTPIPLPPTAATNTTPAPAHVQTSAPPTVVPRPADPAPAPVPVPPRPILPSQWTQLDLSKGFNRNVISGRAQGGDTGLRIDGAGTLLTQRALREAGIPGGGIPEDGDVAMPQSVPPGSFHLNSVHGDDVLFLTAASGPQPAPVHVELPPRQRDQYKSLAVLHASTFGTATISVTIDYTDGTSGTGSFRTFDWARGARTGADLAQRPALTVVTRQPHATDARSTLPVDLFASVMAVDSSKTVKSVRFAIASIQSATEEKFSAGIFAVSALPLSLVDETEWTSAEDLLARIEPSRDGVSGVWRKDSNGLGATGSENLDRLQLPYDYKADFDLRLVFSVGQTVPAGGVAIFCDRGSARFGWVMRGGTNAWFGVEGINGRPAGPSRPGNFYVGQGLIAGGTYDCILKVRGSGLRAIVNGTLVGEWNGDVPLHVDNPQWRLKSTPAIGLGVWNTGGATFKRIAIRTVAQEAGAPLTSGTNTTETAGQPAVDDFPEKALPVARLMAALQLDVADAEVQRLSAGAAPAQQARWTALGSDLSRLVALRRKAADGVTDRTGRAVSWSMRNGQRIEAQLVRADSETITLRKQLPSGFAQVACRWTDVLPSSLLPLFAAVLDPKDPGDIHAYGLLLLYQASAQVARPEDARRALLTAAEKQPSLKADVEERLKWLDAWTNRGGDPGATGTGAIAPKSERGIVVAVGQARYGWRCVDLGAACNADVIYTGSRAAADEFQSPGMGWTTSGWLQRNNIIGEFTGIPDDGRLAVMDEGDRSIFDFTMPPRRNVIMLGGDAGRWPKAVKLDLDGDGGRFEELALLHAASGGDATLVVTLDYGDGHSETKRLQVLDWNTATRKSDVSPGQRIAVATRSNKMTNMNRLEMVAETIALETGRPLTSITLAHGGDRGTAIGVFAISGHGPRGRERDRENR